MLADITILLSAVLLFMSGEAVMVALIKIARVDKPGPLGWSPSPAMRRWLLAAFALYLSGAVVREIGVLLYGITLWQGGALIWSGAGRALSVAGASLYVGLVTYRPCGHWVWAVTLGVGFLLGFVHLAVSR